VGPSEFSYTSTPSSILAYRVYCHSREFTFTFDWQFLAQGAFYLVTQVDTNIILSFLTFNKKQRQNDTCVDLCH